MSHEVSPEFTDTDDDILLHYYLPNDDIIKSCIFHKLAYRSNGALFSMTVLF